MPPSRAAIVAETLLTPTIGVSESIVPNQFCARNNIFTSIVSLSYIW